MHTLAHRPEIVGYTYQSDNYCRACLPEVMGQGDVPPDRVEVMLDLMGHLRHVDRADESSFDSDDFPKVITLQMSTAEPYATVCGRCDVALPFDGDDPDQVDDEQDTDDFCPDCLIAWDLHPFRTGTLRDCMRAITQEAAGRKRITD